MEYCYQDAFDTTGKFLPPLTTSPFYMLGKCYQPERSFVQEVEKALTESADFTILDNTVKRFPNLLTDFTNLFWFTYRKDFPRIEPSPYTSDAGWGCMMRSGQMLLAKAFACYLLGKDWKPKPDYIDPSYTKILRWFGDFPNCPYSIHKISQCGLKFSKNVGEWFGPSTIAQVLEELMLQHKPGMRIYVSGDGCLYLDQIRQICVATKWGDESIFEEPPPILRGTRSTTNGNGEKSDIKGKERDFDGEEAEENDRDGFEVGGGGAAVSEEYWHPMLLVVPLRLGLDTMNETYFPSLKETFHLPQSLGVIGGKPRASYYFIGYQDDYLFYLDPHSVQPPVPLDDMDAEAVAGGGRVRGYHCSVPQRLPIADIDPSLALAFYCESRSDFEDFCKRSRELNSRNAMIFTIVEKTPEYLKRKRTPPKGHSEKLFSDDEDDIVFL